MALTAIKDAYIPFKNQGILVFKVYISKQQKNQWSLISLICLYRNQKKDS